MIIAKTRLKRMPRTCRECTISLNDGWGERVCGITKKDCPLEVVNGRVRYGKPGWCPLREQR